MTEYVLPLQRLIEQFGSLPGIGRKTALRLALAVLELDDSRAADFANAILSAKSEIGQCPVCHNLCCGELCDICADTSRDSGTICVVEDVRAVMAFERVREFRGVYHVLGGALSPVNGINVEDLNINDLAARVKKGGVKEVLIATNPTVEGETTAQYIAKILSPAAVKVSRLAYGVPVGGDLEYADVVTLMRAIDGRREIN